METADHCVVSNLTLPGSWRHESSLNSDIEVVDPDRELRGEGGGRGHFLRTHPQKNV